MPLVATENNHLSTIEGTSGIVYGTGTSNLVINSTSNTPSITSYVPRGGNMCAEVSYFLSSEIENRYESYEDIYYYIKMMNINVTDINDNKLKRGETIFTRIEKDFNKWYKNEAEPIDKSTIFWKYTFGLNIYFRELITRVYELFDDANYKIDARLTLDNQIKKYLEKHDRVDNSEFVLMEDVAISNDVAEIHRIQVAIKKVMMKFEKYKKEVYHSFDSCMYKEAFDEIERTRYLIGGLDGLSNYYGDSSNSTCSSSTGMATYLTGDVWGHMTPTGERLNTSEAAENASYEREAARKLQEKLAKKNKKKEKKKLRLAKRMLNKSIETLTSFIGRNDLHCFIGGDEFQIEGKLFNYKVKKKEQYKLIQTQGLQNIHIPYNLDLYDKDDEYLANMCVTFNGCPILDQILSVYLMIKSDDEIALINKTNFSKRSDAWEGNKNLEEHYERFSKGGMFTINEGTYGSVSDNSIELINKKTKEKLKTIKYIREKMILPLFQDDLMISFIFEQVASWDELSDMYSIRREDQDYSENLEMNYLIKTIPESEIKKIKE